MMLANSLNTKKRQRRPNVRLGEIGDASVSVSRWNFLKPKFNVEEKRWEANSRRRKGWNKSRLRYGENWNPNSTKFEVEETGKRSPRMGFGMVNRKRRLKQQWRWGMRSSSTPMGNKAEISHRYDNSNDHAFDTDYGCSDHENWTNLGDACEGYSNDSLPGNSWKEENILPSNDVHCLSERTGATKKMRSGSPLVSGVKGWLVALGFGKYAGLFEFHEVDEEVLYLLTFEDLKEMGILAVGARRRIYSAIQLLNKGNTA